MTRYAPLWQQASNYEARLDRQLIRASWPVGRCVGGRVTAVTDTMNLLVSAGTAAVPLTPGNGCALCYWDANEAPPSLAVSPPPGQSRIDLVYAGVRDPELDAGANNDFVVAVVTGTAAATNPPVPPTPANALALARVTVVGGVNNLNSATIVDVRPVTVAEYDLAADTDVTTTTFTTVLTGTFTPSGERVRADIVGTAFNTAASARTTIQIVSSGVTKMMCAPGHGAAIVPVMFAGTVVFANLTPGNTYTYTVQVSTASGTWRCRAATQPGLENLRLMLSNA